MQEIKLDIATTGKEKIPVLIQYSNGINRVYVEGLPIPILQYYSATVENYSLNNIKRELYNRWLYTDKPDNNTLCFMQGDVLWLPHQNNRENYRFVGSQCLRGNTRLTLIPRRISGSITVRIIKSFASGGYLCLVKGKHIVGNTFPCLVKE